MTKLVAVKTGATTVYVEAADQASAPGLPSIQEAGAGEVGKMAVVTAEQLSQSLKAFCGHIVGSLRELDGVQRPSKAEIEFGLNISAEGNVYVVKGKAEASVKVKAEWDLSHA